MIMTRAEFLGIDRMSKDELRKFLLETLDSDSKLRALVEGMQWCSIEDADAKLCPLYDDGEPQRCKMERLLRETGTCISSDGLCDDAPWHCDSEGGCIPLPQDADGVVVRVGDRMLTSEGERFVVASIDYGFHPNICEGLAWMLWSSDAEFEEEASSCTHASADTWETIIEDALGSRYAAPDKLSSDFVSLVARCRALAGDAK